MLKKTNESFDLIQQNEIPMGYRKTIKYGIVPKDWKVKKIGEIFNRVRNPVDVKKDKYYRQIGIKSHGNGIFYKDAVTGEDLGNKSVFWVEPDCFIVNIVFAWEMAVARTTKNEIGFIASHRFPMYKPVENVLDLDYITNLFKSPRGKHLLNLASPGGAGRNKTLGQKEFAQLDVLIPGNIEEQRKIASIISTWEKAIELKEKLLEQKNEQKKGLMQKLINGEVRLSGFDGKWRTITLEQVAHCLDNLRKPLNSEEREKMKGDIPYYGANGIVDYVNDFIFNEKLILLAEDGGHFDEFLDKPIAMRLSGKSWVNNHAHILKITEADFNFIFYSLVHKDIRKYINGSTRGKLTKSDMLSIELKLPDSIEEQNAISQIFNCLTKEIDLLENNIKELYKQKKGLMQLLLTGKVRVNV